jgi:hypothetical protein
VRGPRPSCADPVDSRSGRRAFIFREEEANTIKPIAVSHGQGWLLWLGAIRPGRIHDITTLRTEGIKDLLRRHPGVSA